MSDETVTYSLPLEALGEFLGESTAQHNVGKKLLEQHFLPDYDVISENVFYLLCGFVAANYELTVLIDNLLLDPTMVESEETPGVEQVLLLDDSIATLERLMIGRYYFAAELNKNCISTCVH
jgi:hypothetical protein